MTLADLDRLVREFAGRPVVLDSFPAVYYDETGATLDPIGPEVREPADELILMLLAERYPGVTFGPADYATWLNPELEDPRLLLPLVRRLPSEELVVVEANRALNATRDAVTGPECLTPPAEGESAADYEAFLAAKATFAVSAGDAPKKPQTRKPRAKKVSGQADLFDA